MKFKSLVKFYIVSLLISVVIFFLVSYSQDNSENWKGNYSREYLNAMSDANFKKFVDSHRNLSEIEYIEAKEKMKISPINSQDHGQFKDNRNPEKNYINL